MYLKQYTNLGLGGSANIAVLYSAIYLKLH